VQQGGKNHPIRTGDAGCSLHPDCFTCPFPDCRYNEPAGERSLKMRALAQKAPWLREQGLTWAAIARRLGVSPPTLRYARRNGGIIDHS